MQVFPLRLCVSPQRREEKNQSTLKKESGRNSRLKAYALRLLCCAIFFQSLATGEATKLESLAVEAISHTTRPIEHKALTKVN